MNDSGQACFHFYKNSSSPFVLLSLSCNWSELRLIMYVVPTGASTLSQHLLQRLIQVLKMQAPKPTLQSSWFRIVARGASWRRKTSSRNTPAGMTPKDASSQGGDSRGEQGKPHGAPTCAGHVPAWLATQPSRCSGTDSEPLPSLWCSPKISP